MTDPVSPACWDSCWQKLFMKNLSYTINVLIVSSFDRYVFLWPWMRKNWRFHEDFAMTAPYAHLNFPHERAILFLGKSYRNLIIWSGGLRTFPKIPRVISENRCFVLQDRVFIWIVSWFPRIIFPFSHFSILGCFWDVSITDFQDFGGKLPETIFQKSDLRKHAKTLLNPEWSTGPTSQHRESVLLKLGLD